MADEAEIDENLMPMVKRRYQKVNNNNNNNNHNPLVRDRKSTRLNSSH